jgi:dynein assembly factor 2
MAGEDTTAPSLEAAFAAACNDPSRKEKFKMTDQEQKSFMKAMKDPEFCSLLNDYMKEISDPANRAEQELYLRQLESENKVPGDKQLIMPKAGFVLKAKHKQKKIFVNVCSSEKIAPPSSTKVAASVTTSAGTSWNLPYCVGPQRLEQDKGHTDSLLLITHRYYLHDSLRHILKCTTHACRRTDSHDL